MLNQARYTWHHNNTLKYITDNINNSEYKVYTDLTYKQTINGGIIPPHLTVTSLHQDTVILDSKNANIFN